MTEQNSAGSSARAGEEERRAQKRESIERETRARGITPKHGGYRELLSYQKAEIVHDATIRFCGRFLSRSDRTVDQMVQAARSGKQNIIEASQASGGSKEAEIKLTHVARASLEELLADYLDFLRQRGSIEWPREHPYGQRMRTLNRQRGATTRLSNAVLSTLTRRSQPT